MDASLKTFLKIFFTMDTRFPFQHPYYDAAKGLNLHLIFWLSVSEFMWFQSNLERALAVPIKLVLLSL